MEIRLYKLVAAAWIETTEDLVKEYEIIKVEYENGKYEVGIFKDLILKLR